MGHVVEVEDGGYVEVEVSPGAVNLIVSLAGGVEAVEVRLTEDQLDELEMHLRRARAEM